MEVISPQELRQQYLQLPVKPELGFNSLWSNVLHLAKKHIFTNELLNASPYAFILRCTCRIPESGQKPKQLIVKCFSASTHAALSSAVELFQFQQETKNISRYIESYTSYIYNSDDDMMNMLRDNVYRCSIESIYRMNAVSGVLNRFEQIFDWMSQLLEAVSLLHERGFLHGGINPSNVFIDESTNEIRLVDVGFAVRIASMEIKQRQGDIYRFSQHQDQQAIIISQSSDVRALIVLMYQMTFGFDCTYGVIQQLEQGTPFDEAEQDNNPNENEETDFKYLMVKLANRVLCKNFNKNQQLQQYSVFFIGDIIHQRRTLDPLECSPSHVAAALERTLPHSKPLNAVPKSNSDGFVEQIDDIIEPIQLDTAPYSNTLHPMIQIRSVEQQFPEQLISPIQQQQQFDQEELLRQEILYQQMQAELKMEKEVYAQKQMSLQEKIELYKSNDKLKYQTGSSPMPSQGCLSSDSDHKDSGHHRQKSTGQKNKQENHTYNLCVTPPEYQATQEFNPSVGVLTASKTGQVPIEQILSFQNQQNSTSFIGSSAHLITNNCITEPQQISQQQYLQPFGSLTKISHVESQHQLDQQHLHTQSSQLAWPEELIRNLSNTPNKQQRTQSLNDAEIIGIPGITTPVAFSQVKESQQQLSINQQEQAKDEHFHDEWVLDFTEVKNVQRGDDTRPSEYISEIPQPQQASHNQSYAEQNQNNSQSALYQQSYQQQYGSASTATNNNYNNNNNSTNNYSSGSYQYPAAEPALLSNNSSQIQLASTQAGPSQPEEQITLTYPNGQLKYIGTILGDKMHGSGRLYDEQGIVIYSGGFSNGEYDGYGCEYYENGAKIFEGTYQNGYLNGNGRSFFKNGIVSYEGGFKEGQCHGENGAKFSDRGILVSVSDYVNGKMNGKFTRFYENAKVEFQGFAKNNKREGNATEYYMSGAIRFSGVYSKGKKVSGIEFDEQGAKTFEGIFEDEDEE